ncbi:ABC transporter permease [Rhodopirellula sp. MGV]|uniref:ABC transporter permease n=1 Tax=Rhodopirellula sp. MGV TaxID=2023130 RepID=UPI000B97478C|nr:ABC transporter permease [Rhodopirellula sp. MGV]OYP37544.1 ABC transporter permease [Rhodopirellula sp. MGV]PNY37984.1 ABC transporter permease [Rhodopirellula baltica]
MLANLTAASSGLLFDAASTVSSGLLVGQIGDWMPSWATPIYAISVGLLLGAIVAAVFYGVLALLSFLPPLGTLASNPTRGSVVSLILGGGIGVLLCTRFAPSSEEYAQSLYLPLLIAGVILGYAIVYGMWYRTRQEWFDILGEGIVPYILSTLGVFALIGMLGTYYVTDPLQFVQSLRQVHVFSDGTVVTPLTVPGADASVGPDEAIFHPQKLDYDLRSMSELIIETNKTIMLGDGSSIAEFSRKPTRIDAGERMVYRYEDRDVPPLPADPSQLHIQNRELDPATVTFTITTVPKVPQATQAVAIGVVIFFLISALVAFRQAAPRVWALALSTAKNEMAQTLYLILLAIGIFGVVVFSIYPFNTLGDDIRMFKDSSVTLIMVLAMLQAVWSAGTSVSEEIEGRTALTVLSKPVSRRSFLLGKYAGIMMSIAVMFLIIGTVLLLLMSYKPIYDARETARALPAWQMGFEEIMSTIPVLGLYFMQTMSIAAIAVALATRLPLLSNLITCLVIYVIGNLTQPLVASARGENPLVGFVGNLIAIVVPNLNIFNVQSAMDSGNQVPWIYLAASFNYLVVFAVAIWMVAMLLFEDRDLA